LRRASTLDLFTDTDDKADPQVVDLLNLWPGIRAPMRRKSFTGLFVTPAAGLEVLEQAVVDGHSISIGS
jgi:hypothetical protein